MCSKLVYSFGPTHRQRFTLFFGILAGFVLGMRERPRLEVADPPELAPHLHRHDHGRVIIPLQGGTMDIVESTGAKEEHVWDRGHAYWLPAMPPGAMHMDVNAGSKPIEVMVVELKNDK